MNDDMRRIARINLCCRAVVSDRYGVWTGVTEDVSATGCRIVTPRLLRTGSAVVLNLSSDLVPEELEVQGRAAWATPSRLAVAFTGPSSRPGAPSPQEWMERVLGAVSGGGSRIVPTIHTLTVPLQAPLPVLEPFRLPRSPQGVVEGASRGTAESVPMRLPASRID